MDYNWECGGYVIRVIYMRIVKVLDRVGLGGGFIFCSSVIILFFVFVF